MLDVFGWTLTNKYVIELLQFYQNNKEAIKNNDQDVAKLLELIKDKMERQ